MFLVSFLATRVLSFAKLLLSQAIFLTFNPADVKHPFTLRFSNQHGCTASFPSVHFDAALHGALCDVNLFHLVAEDPVAAVRAFHTHVSTLFSTLLRCSSRPQDLAVDGIASDTIPGIFGPLAAIYGCIEPQLRGSLHIHMLLYIYGFSSPQQFVERFESKWSEIRAARPISFFCHIILMSCHVFLLQVSEARLWTWVDSILHTSVEAVPRVWGLDGSTCLHHLRPLPFSDQHLQMLGDGELPFVERAAHTWRATCVDGGGWPACAPWDDPLDDCVSNRPEYLPFARSYLAEASATYTRCLLYDFRHSIVHNALHDCRPATCFKGWIGGLAAPCCDVL